MRTRALLLTLLAVTVTCVLAQIPKTMSYQGLLTDASGKKVSDGNYQLTFKLYEAATGGTAVWSEVQTVAVSNGLFNVYLGSVTPLNLTFKKPYWLGITIASGAELSPRMALATSPYSFSTFGLQGTENVFPAAGLVGIGVTNPMAKLHVYGRIVTTDESIRQISAGGWADMSSNAGGAGLFSGNSYTSYDPTNNVRYRYANTHNKIGSIGFAVNYPAWNQASVIASSDTFSTADKVFTPKAIAVFTQKGNMGIGVSAPTEKLQVDGIIHSKTGGFKFPDGSVQTKAATGSGSGTIGGNGTMNYLSKFTNSTTLGNSIFYESNGHIGIGTTTPGYNPNGWNERCITISSPNGSAFQFARNTPYNGSFNGEVMWINTHNTPGNDEISTIIGLTQGTSTNKGGALGFYTKQNNVSGLPKLRMLITDIGNVCLGTETALAKLTVAGNVVLVSASTGAKILELGEGLDYAEGFDLSNDDILLPGTVLVIDPAFPGKLSRSRVPYDSRVAGIIAGANDLKSGVRLGGDKFDHDVALAGRVYCNVDATESAIEPGDLLTTSQNPGYAMKATDYERSRGAILGKAMGAMDKGKKGQILVLVTLQ